VVHEGRFGDTSSLTVYSDDAAVGSVALGYLFLDDERCRPTVLDGLRKLGIPVAQPTSPRPEATANTDWTVSTVPPNVRVGWQPGGMKLRWAEPEGPSTRTTFAQYNPTTKTMWVADRPLIAPACIFAARLGLEVEEVGLPPERWELAKVGRRRLRDLEYEWTGRGPKMKPLNHEAADLVPPNLFTDDELQRFAQPGHKPGLEPTEFLERLTGYRELLFPEHSYLDVIDTCRICGRPAGIFRSPICDDDLAYCHRCLAFAVDGLPNMAANLKRATERALQAARALADAEFNGSAFVEAQLTTITGNADNPVAAKEIDRRILLRIAITRGQLPWTRVLIDAGLADDGIRLSRGTVLKAVDGHLCLSMQENLR
jgi:hypothetical protein